MQLQICTGHCGYCYKLLPVPRVLWRSLTELTEVPGKGMGFLQNLQKFRVRARKSYRTSRNSGYRETGVQNPQKFRAGTKHAVPVPRVLCPRAYRTYRSFRYGYECTHFPEVPGTGMNILQNLQKLLCRVTPGVNTPGMVCRYPTERSLETFDLTS